MWMSSNPEMTAICVKERLEKQCGVQVSKEWVCHIRRRLNWSAKNMKYGQLISHKNVKHRQNWCIEQLICREKFENVIFVDESTVEMCSAGRLFFHQNGSNLDRLPGKAPKPKHALKVNVWRGISYRGRTDVCIFTGIMDSEIYISKFLRTTLFPLPKPSILQDSDFTRY